MAMPACAVACLTILLFTAISPPARALDRSQLALIGNTADPLSVAIGKYYAERRRILYSNVIKVEFPPGRTTLTREEFAAGHALVEEQTMPAVQAYVLTWAAPYRVACMSITTAFAFGFDPAFCAEDCKATRPSPYFNSRVRLPFKLLNMRPTMAIAASSLEGAKALIDRGVQSDGSFPSGAAYLLSTSDAARNVRSASYPLAQRFLGRRAHVMEAEALKGANDVLFYFIGKDPWRGSTHCASCRAPSQTT